MELPTLFDSSEKGLKELSMPAIKLFRQLKLERLKNLMNGLFRTGYQKFDTIK